MYRKYLGFFSNYYQVVSRLNSYVRGSLKYERSAKTSTFIGSIFSKLPTCFFLYTVTVYAIATSPVYPGNYFRQRLGNDLMSFSCIRKQINWQHTFFFIVERRSCSGPTCYSVIHIRFPNLSSQQIS